MTGMRRIAVFVVVGGLSACASTPLEDHYYSLVLAADETAATAVAGSANAYLVVGPVELPDFLEQRGIAIQTGSNQIRTANHHFWAEPLREAIAKVLARDIARATSGVTVDRDAGRWTGPGDCRVRIEFDKFHATSDSHVVVSGRYWVLSGDAIARQEFAVTRILSTDGYAHAVTALRAALGTVAEQISGTVAGDSPCSAEDAEQGSAR
jgi:uncharacterized protein